MITSYLRTVKTGVLKQITDLRNQVRMQAVNALMGNWVSCGTA
jgi:hypothetical protein